MQERHGLPLRSFSSGKALTAGRAVRPEVAQERRYLQGAPLGLELPGRIALRDPHCAWQWFEPEAAAEAFPAAHWLAAFLVLLGRYGNEEITLGFPEPITVRGRQAPALLRSSYRAMESSAERSARLAEELDDARRQLSADGQERAALAGRCAVQVLAARPTASSPGWLALVLAADGSVGLALRDPQYDELRRIAGHLARLARGLVDAQACVGRLPWLDADEERRLQALRSEPQAAPSRGVLHHLFEAQARRTPQRIAVHAADRSLSYAELERESAALAVRLRAAGVAPEQRVGVCLRRDSGLLVGLLGVLRAGGCYVPLDPAYPEERVAYMLDDADCLLVLVDTSTRERVAALGRPCLTLEEGGDQANDLALPASEVGADHLAYIIYTSGSTGRPKGVAIEHGSAHAFLRWAGQHYAAEEWSGVLAATSVCFDLSVYELFGTLAEGGTLHLVENLFSLPDYPRRDEISLLNTVPSVCAALLALGDLPGGVRTLNLAGEPLRGHLVRQIRGQPQVRRLVNLYGPTEDTTYSTAHELDLHAEALDEPPIGRPLPGTTVEVLDGFEAPLPLGVAGELYLGGIGLARGYFGKPEQTAERFRVDPGSGERRYRTGDRVRMREDGVLEHLGRLDDQVKFNGFRIELGEIASCLASFPGVSEACAMLTEDSAGLRRLVGYLAAPFAPPLQALNEHLGQSLPHYMLPSAFVVLAELPKTLNGKIDRKALPRPQASGAEPQALPSDPLEQALHQAWQAQLGAPPRAGQGFYAAGGDSLRAVHLLATLRQRLSRRVPLQAFAGGPATPEALLELLRQAAPEGDEPEPSAGAAGLSLAERRLWVAQQLAPEDTSYNLLAHLRIVGATAEAIEQALRQLLERHVALRRRVETGVDGPQPHALAAHAVPLQRLLASDAVHAERLLEDGVRREGARVFDLAHEAPARLLLVVTRDSARADLLLSVHHYAFDDVSLAVFAAELKTLLDGGRLGVLASTPEQVAARERAALASGRLDRVAERWAERLLPLAKAPGAAPARPEESGGRAGQRLALPVSAAVHAACRALAERTSVSPFSAALQAFAEVLGAELGVDDLLVGVALAGRSRLEMQGLVGCFVNLLPLAVGLRPEQSVEWRLRQVGHDLLELLEHQDVPLECVTQALRQRGASGLPIRIACGAHNGRAAPAVDAGVRVEADFIPVPGARLDLTLWLEDQPQGWLAVWTGVSAIFDLHRIERLHQAWERRLLANAGEPISKRMSPEGCNAS